MSREQLKFTEYEIKPILYEYAFESDEYCDENGCGIEGPWDDFGIIETSVEYTDLEKAYEDRRVIVQRISDGKLFEGNYSFSYHRCDYNTLLTEVFPKDIVITIYE